MKLIHLYNLKPTFKSYSDLFQLLSRRRKIQIFYLFLLSIFSAVSEAANIGLLIPFLDILGDAENNIYKLGIFGSVLKNLPPNLLLLSLAFFFILLIVISSCIRSFTIRTQFRLGSLICADLGKIAFKSILSKPFEDHIQSKSSNVISLLTQDVERVGAIVKGFLSICVNSIIIVVVGIFLLITSFQIMLSAIISLCLFYFIIYQAFRRDFSNAGRERTYNFRKCVKVIQESLGGIRELILGNHHDLFVENYDNYNRKRFLNDAKILIKASIPRYLVEAFLIIIVTSIALYNVLSGNELYELLPTLVAISLGIYKLMQPVQICFNTIGTLQANQAPLKEFLHSIVIADSSDNQPSKTVGPIKNKFDSTVLIEFDNVSFKYKHHCNMALQNINLSIHKGESVALVGFTGSGKSTLADLVLGLLKPSKGNILVDNINLHHDQAYLDLWQQRIAHVPQSIYLNDTDIQSNIAYGISTSKINLARLHEAARQASIASFIESLSDGYKTSIGERGTSLSGGQRQRIGIARALYKQSEMLILDEATSALDNYTEKLVMNSIRDLRGRVTLLVIAHRLSTIMHCDRIILLEAGKISAVGNYEDLLTSSTIFKNLVSASSDQAN